MSKKNQEVLIKTDEGNYHYKNGKPHRLNGPAIEHADGGKEWWVNGELHREDGPAVEYADGGKEWWVNGKLHRDDGPAIIKSEFNQWYYEGKRHRLDGPAVEYSIGYKFYYVNDCILTYEEYEEYVGVPTDDSKYCFNFLGIKFIKLNDNKWIRFLFDIDVWENGKYSKIEDNDLKSLILGLDVSNPFLNPILDYYQEKYSP
jgi:hypothetical protein